MEWSYSFYYELIYDLIEIHLFVIYLVIEWYIKKDVHLFFEQFRNIYKDMKMRQNSYRDIKMGRKKKSDYFYTNANTNANKKARTDQKGHDTKENKSE